MLLAEDGAVRLDDGTALGPDMRLDDFLGSALAAVAREGVQRDDWRSWVVPELRIEGRSFRAMLCFSDGRLGMLDLTLQAPELGRWYETSPETEVLRRARHDALLEAALGPAEVRETAADRWRRGRCEVLSITDPRSGAAAIHLRYGWAEDEDDEEEDD